MKLYAQVFLKRLIKTHNFFWSDWWKYSDITQQSHVLVQPAAVVVVMYSIHWSSRSCALLLIAGVSAFMLLMMSLWNLTMFRYVSRYVLYHDLCIEIRIVSWGTRIVTPLIQRPRCPKSQKGWRAIMYVFTKFGLNPMSGLSGNAWKPQSGADGQLEGWRAIMYVFTKFELNPLSGLSRNTRKPQSLRLPFMHGLFVSWGSPGWRFCYKFSGKHPSHNWLFNSWELLQTETANQWVCDTGSWWVTLTLQYSQSVHRQLDQLDSWKAIMHVFTEIWDQSHERFDEKCAETTKSDRQRAAGRTFGQKDEQTSPFVLAHTHTNSVGWGQIYS